MKPKEIIKRTYYSVTNGVCFLASELLKVYKKEKIIILIITSILAVFLLVLFGYRKVEQRDIRQNAEKLRIEQEAQKAKEEAERKEELRKIADEAKKETEEAKQKAEFEKEIKEAIGGKVTEKNLRNLIKRLEDASSYRSEDGYTRFDERICKKLGYARQMFDSVCRASNFSSLPYSNVNKIDNELYLLYYDLYHTTNGELFDSYSYERFVTRLEFHLKNPLTFNNKLPRTNSYVNISRTPDEKYKFYSFNDGGISTGKAYTTYIQYKDNSGKMVFRKWKITRRDLSGRNSLFLL